MFEAILPRCTDANVDEHIFLQQLLEGATEDEKNQLRDDALPVLAHAGFVVQSSGRVSFAIPNAGRFVIMVRNGRDEVLTTLRRRKPVQEMLLRDLHEVRMRRSILGVDFHLLDLLGLSLVELCDTPIGPIVRLAQ